MLWKYFIVMKYQGSYDGVPVYSDPPRYIDVEILTCSCLRRVLRTVAAGHKLWKSCCILTYVELADYIWVKRSFVRSVVLARNICQMQLMPNNYPNDNLSLAMLALNLNRMLQLFDWCTERTVVNILVLVWSMIIYRKFNFIRKLFNIKTDYSFIWTKSTPTSNKDYSFLNHLFAVVWKWKSVNS